jgi:hypothetical protein
MTEVQVTPLYGGLLFQQYQAAATLATLYVVEEVIGDVGSFNFTVSLSELLLKMRHMESLPYIDTIDRLARFARTPHSLDKAMESVARAEMAMHKASSYDEKLKVLRALVAIMHNRRIAYTRVASLYGKYGISLLEPSHDRKHRKGRTLHAQRTTRHREDHAGPAPVVH